MTTTLALSPVLQIEARLAPLRARLTAHPLYSRIQTLTDLHTFMESHVFAVWDFMSLLKSLQARLTCVTVPWVPTPWPESRRFINEIVLGEESDHYRGRAISHFELYLEAMEESGADTAAMRELLRTVDRGEFSADALAIPHSARRFVHDTFTLIREGKLHEIAAAFTFGREDVIPDIFRGLVRDLDRELAGKLGKFVWYLERHIEIDGDDHGPLSLRMVADLCGDDEQSWAEAGLAAEAALRSRLALWDGILERLGPSYLAG